MTEPLLAMSGIRVRFPGVLALDEVSVTLERGEIHGLIGENGAGKSTLMKVLGGAVAADRGSIHLDGRPAAFAGPAEAATAGIAIVHQHLALVPVLTVAENLVLGVERALVQRYGREGVNARIDRALERVGIAELRDRRAEGLQPAESRLVMIAQGLVREARILVLDEPTAVLTRSETDRLMDQMRSLRQDETGIFYISHRLKEIVQVCDRVTVMRDGRVVFTGAMDGMGEDDLARLVVGGEIASAGAAVRRGRPPAGGTPVIECRGLVRAPRVRGVDLEVHAGEVLGLAGLVGSGRTEVARLIVGADAQDAGTVLLRGEPLRRRTPRSMARRGVVLVPEDRRHLGVFAGLTVRENMSLPLLRQLPGARGPFLSRKAERDTVARVAREVDVRPADALESPIELLSGGNQQKVVIGRWLLHHADVVIFDEPTEGIDIGARSEIHALMRRLADRGAAIVVISSDLDELTTIVDRAVVLRDGRSVAELRGAELTESAVLEHCYAGAGRDLETV